jgi:hypothetical protein
MRQRYWILALVLGLGLGMTARAGDSPPVKVDAEKINKLIEQLSSGKFIERTKASKELDAIGVPALEALRKAAQSDVPEVSKRATELIKKIEDRTLTSNLLAPTRVRLVFKNTPVPDAVAELAKKSGYTIHLEGDKAELAKRKITLDTGDTTFWKALDALCQKANLVETNAMNRFIGPPNGPPIKIGPPIKGKGAPPGVLPVVPQPKQGKIELNGQAAVGGQGIQVQVQLPGGGGVQQIQIQVPQIQPGQPGGLPAMAPPIRPLPGFGSGQIILTDGKPQNYPTSYHGAVRFRIVPQMPPNMPQPQAVKDQVTLILEVTPEPKLQNFNVLGTPTIEKIVDDQGQKLTVAMEPADKNPGGGEIIVGGPGGGVAARIAMPAPWLMGGQRYVVLRVKVGEKKAKTLKELTGNISASVLAPPEPLITVDNILKAKGKSAKGKNGGSLEVIDVTKREGGDIEVKFKMVNPQVGGGIGGGPVIQPLPLPAQPPGGAKVPPPPKGAPVQIQPVQPGGGGFGGGGVVRPGVGFAPPGLTLQDAKGKAFQVMSTQSKGSFDGKVFTQEYTMVFRPQPGGQGEADRLVYSGQRNVTVQIPFAFKNVRLP